MSKLAASVPAVTRRLEMFILKISTNYRPGAFRHSPFHLLELCGSQSKEYSGQHSQQAKSNFSVPLPANTGRKSER